MILNIIVNISRRLNQLSGALAMLLIAYLLCHILLEIVLRQFGTSTYILDEFVGYAIATTTFLGLGYSLERNGLIKVNILSDRVAEKYHWLLELFIAFVSFMLFSWVSYYWYINVARSYKRNITSESIAETPLWIPEGMVLVGLVLLCMTLFVRMLSLVITRQTPDIETNQ
ncbi:MAG: TRAP transporter small permease [Marinomonas sp.]